MQCLGGRFVGFAQFECCLAGQHITVDCALVRTMTKQLITAQGNRIRSRGAGQVRRSGLLPRIQFDTPDCKEFWRNGDHPPDSSQQRLHQRGGWAG
jgi:hypothetical protein